MPESQTADPAPEVTQPTDVVQGTNTAEVAQELESAPTTASPQLPPDDNQVRDIRETDGSGEVPLSPSIDELLKADSEEAEAAPEETPAENGAEMQSLRDAASAAGYDVSKFDDDAAALQHLVEQARQVESQQAQLQQYQQMLAQQQQHLANQPPAPPAPEASQEPEGSLWNPPEFNPVWLSQIKRDETGQLVPDLEAGGTQEIVQKVSQWADYRKSQQDKFWDNPYEFMKPMVEEVARAQTMNGLSANQEVAYAENLIDQNKDWIFQNGDRNQEFTADGKLFADTVAQLPDASAAVQYDYAMKAVEHARMSRELEALKGQQSAVQTHEQKKKAAIGHKPNSSGTLQANVEQNPNLSLKERMMAAMKQNGINAIDFERS